MTDEARLEPVDSGLAPASDGWFVLNVADAVWLTHETFGARCVFEGDVPVVRSRPELGVHRFAELGFRLTVVEPGQPTTLYHAEAREEAFLVLAGECLLIVEGQERTLRAWDFFHCAPVTRHAFVGAGTEPCVLLGTGARGEWSIVYPRSEEAALHGASAEAETDSPAEAYAPYPHWRLGRPGAWAALPWA